MAGRKDRNIIFIGKGKDGKLKIVVASGTGDVEVTNEAKLAGTSILDLLRERQRVDEKLIEALNKAGLPADKGTNLDVIDPMGKLSKP